MKMKPSIEKAVENILGAAATNALKLTQGEVNEVYQVETEQGLVVVKVFSNSLWPEDGKLDWIEKQLTRCEVPHARTLYYSRDDTYFPHGLMISEYVEGRNAAEALDGGSLSLEEYCSKVGALLKQVHQIPLNLYGYIGQGTGVYDSFVEFKLIHEVKERLREIEDLNIFEKDFYDRVEEKIKKQLASFERWFSPVLAHEDAQPKNAVWTHARRLVLIDWDEAIASAWITDYAKLTYGLNETDESAREKMRDAFFQGYGESEFTPQEIGLMENALHVVQSIDLLPYYRDKGNTKAFKQTQDRLLTLLD
jgi:Ser/Thr protein kinase RdoA (MazF antagonist)